MGWKGGRVGEFFDNLNSPKSEVQGPKSNGKLVEGWRQQVRMSGQGQIGGALPRRRHGQAVCRKPQRICKNQGESRLLKAKNQTSRVGDRHSGPRELACGLGKRNPTWKISPRERSGGVDRTAAPHEMPMRPIWVGGALPRHRHGQAAR
jgi:hypothetical protein